MRPNSSGYCALENGLPTNARNLTAYAPSPAQLPTAVTHAQQRHHHHHQQQQQFHHAAPPPQHPATAQWCAYNPHQRTHPPLNAPQHSHNNSQHRPLQLQPPPFQHATQHRATLQETTSRNYSKLSANGVNQQRINECAGIPLISTAAAHVTQSRGQRLLRRVAHTLPLAQKPTVVGDSYGPPAAYNWHLPAPTAAGRNMAQLAAHAQGAPLLLHKQHATNGSSAANSSSNAVCNWTTSYTNNRFVPASANHNPPALAFKADRSRMLRYQNSAPAVLSSRTKENAVRHSTPADSVVESAVGTSQDFSETCLPRIIKPRKRRKKDRKPTNGVFLKMDTEVELPLHITAAVSGVSANDSRKPYKSNENILSGLDCYTQLPSASLTERIYQVPEPALTHNMAKQSLSSCSSSASDTSVQPKSTTNISIGAESDTHGICCCCRVCNPLRSIWDYPLRRSLSDSSATSNSAQSCSNSSTASEALSAGAPSLANQAFGELFTPITATRTRAEIVGVIGSNRGSHDGNNNNNSIPQSNTNNNNNRYAANSSCLTKPTNNAGCLSDSNDSGYGGDILSGINLADNLFSHTSSSANSDTKCALAPTTSLLLLPETAETLLTESINEISRKLIETCAHELPELEPPPTTHSLSAYSACNDFSSDSGIDSAGSSGAGCRRGYNCNELVFSFDYLNIADNISCSLAAADAKGTEGLTTTSHTNFSLMPPTMDELLSDFDRNRALKLKEGNSNDSGNNKNNNKQSGNFPETRAITLQRQQQQQQQHSQQFLSNCYDLVWQNAFLMEDGSNHSNSAAMLLGRKLLQTTTPTTPTAFSTIS